MLTVARRRGLALLVVSLPLAACGGGSPLLHPAHVLPSGDVRVAAGTSANVAVGSIADDLSTARNIAAQDPNAPGPPGQSPEYARGALVAAAVAPGIAPFVGGRVGVGSHFEGGLAYTGRSVRFDARRSFEDGAWALSIGAGLSAALYGRDQSTTLPNVELQSLRGWGGDIPVLVGWRSAAGIYQAWGGARLGVERDIVDTISTEPRPGVPGPIRLEATRTWAGGVVGLATGFRHVHVAVELDVAYQSVVGRYNATEATVKGVTLAPATALWWSF